MTDGTRGSGAGGAHDPGEVLDAVLTATRMTGNQAIIVLRPVHADDGSVRDFTIVVDSGLLTRLAGTRSAGRTLREVLPAASADRMVASGVRTLAAGTATRDEVALAVTDAGVVPDLTGESGVLVRRGEVTRVAVGGLVVLLGRDITAERTAEETLAVREERYRRLVEHSSDPIVLVSADGTIRYASPAARTVLHRDPDDLVGARVCSVTHPDDAAACAELVAEAARAPVDDSRGGRLRTLDPEGHVGWVAVTATNWLDDDAVGGVVLNIRDVTEQRAAEERLQREALQDPLTGLPNRRWFLRALEEAASRSERSGAPYAVLMLDVDDFKAVNDTLGHAAGDEVLEELAGRLAGALRPSDTAARLGGDELVVIAEGLHGSDDAESVAGRILSRCSGSYRIGGAPTPVTVSIGVATSASVGPDGAASSVDPQRVLTLADVALYEAKRRGRNRIEVYGPDHATRPRDAAGDDGPEDDAPTG